MTDNEKILSNIVKTTDFGQSGINYVMKGAQQPALRQALKVQRLEYQTIGARAKNLAKAKGLEIQHGNKMMCHMSGMGSRARLMGKNKDSKIAGMMIQGNTRGMIQSLKQMHSATNVDPEVAQLAQKLLDTEVNNIESMEGFV